MTNYGSSKVAGKYRRRSPAKGLTPYQGVKRVYGHFTCPTPACRNTWSSGSSWRDTAQSCHRCKVMVFPRKQDLLDGIGRCEDRRGPMNGRQGPMDVRRGPMVARPGHDELNCERCRETGTNCRKLDMANFECARCQGEWQDDLTSDHSSKCPSCGRRQWESGYDVADGDFECMCGSCWKATACNLNEPQVCMKCGEKVYGDPPASGNGDAADMQPANNDSSEQSSRGANDRAVSSSSSTASNNHRPDGCYSLQEVRTKQEEGAHGGDVAVGRSTVACVTTLPNSAGVACCIIKEEVKDNSTHAAHPIVLL